MKAIKYLLIVFLAAQIINAQSIVVGAGASIDVGVNADVCATTHGNITGTITGGGTECGALPLDVLENKIVPAKFALYQNYPNPFNPTTKISWQSPVSGWQTLKVYDVLGNEIATLVNEEKPAGNYEFDFNAIELKSNVYFYRIIIGNYIAIRKMILMK
jgi:hypothetical protein